VDDSGSGGGSLSYLREIRDKGEISFFRKRGSRRAVSEESTKKIKKKENSAQTERGAGEALTGEKGEGSLRERWAVNTSRAQGGDGETSNSE